MKKKAEKYCFCFGIFVYLQPILWIIIKILPTSRFYYFDVGVVNHLLNRANLLPGSVDFGHAFEHLMIQELVAYLSYSESEEQLSYWRTASGYEVDAVIGNFMNACAL